MAVICQKKKINFQAEKGRYCFLSIMPINDIVIYFILMSLAETIIQKVNFANLNKVSPINWRRNTGIAIYTGIFNKF